MDQHLPIPFPHITVDRLRAMEDCEGGTTPLQYDQYQGVRTLSNHTIQFAPQTVQCSTHGSIQIGLSCSIVSVFKLTVLDRGAQ
jgi:hypothetical protein